MRRDDRASASRRSRPVSINRARRCPSPPTATSSTHLAHPPRRRKLTTPSSRKFASTRRVATSEARAGLRLLGTTAQRSGGVKTTAERSAEVSSPYAEVRHYTGSTHGCNRLQAALSVPYDRTSTVVHPLGFVSRNRRVIMYIRKRDFRLLRRLAFPC